MGKIFDIKHFAVHDGDGIRTTVFFKGCPLRCAWCHNPEGLLGASELALFFEKCTLCKRCASVCPHSAHVFDAAHTVDRSACIGCGECVRACAGDALVLYGREVKVEEILPELIEDRDFYGERGGVTLSGGECLLQSKFCAELLSALKAQGINTAVDTSGAVCFDAFFEVMPYTDTFLYDIKAIDESTHIRCTGRTNKDILENLRRLSKAGADVEIRIPYVPGYNDTEIPAIGEFLTSLENIKRVRVLPYHRYYESKYLALGYSGLARIEVPTESEIAAAKKLLSSYGLTVLD